MNPLKSKATRREFLIFGIGCAAAFGLAYPDGRMHAQQAPGAALAQSYGSGSYGQGQYPAVKVRAIYLPFVQRGE